jgi:hypothetical protein
MTRVFNDPHRIARTGTRYLITLSCGHKITARNSPLHPTVKYGCGLGLGCGYQLPWISYREVGGTEVYDNKGVDKSVGALVVWGPQRGTKEEERDE